MGDEIHSTLYMEFGTDRYCSTEDIYSVAAYAYGQLSKTTAPVALKTLCAELLRYGASAQVYKQYRTDALVDGAMTPEQQAYLWDLDAVPFGVNNRLLDDLESPSVTWVGKSLDLASKVCIRFVVNTGSFDGDPNTLCLKLSYADHSGQTKTLILTEPVLYQEGTPYYAFDFSDLPATELRALLTATVYCGEEQISPTLEYSADTYGNGKTGALKDLCAALFAYSDAATAYFQSFA